MALVDSIKELARAVRVSELTTVLNPLYPSSNAAQTDWITVRYFIGLFLLNIGYKLSRFNTPFVSPSFWNAVLLYFTVVNVLSLKSYFLSLKYFYMLVNLVT